MASLFDPFSILGLPPTMGLQRPQIDAAYFAQVTALHPDTLRADSSQNSSPDDEQEPEARMAMLNQARATLADPERRAEALLTLLGGPGKDNVLPPTFLMEFMEIREQVDAAIESGDATTQMMWQEWARTERLRLIREVEQSFERSDLRGVRSLLNAWRYVERLAEALSNAQGGSA
jgi:curved DNA-binding protein CbpA